jgi:replicative DNA helicase
VSLYNLDSALRANRSVGQPLPVVWKGLEAATAVFRRPQLVVIASAPGGGKSALALNLAVKSKVPAVYFSADSGAGTQIPRTVSIVTGIETDIVRRDIEQGKSVAPFLREHAPHLWWEFNPAPTPELIDETIQAYGYLGRYPDLCIVDNLVDVDNGGAEGEWKAFENTLLFLKELSRERNMCVVVLAHLTGEFEDGVTVPPLSGLRGKVSKIPEMILTLFREENPLGGEDMGVAIVKNRDGIANASGRHTVSLRMDLSRMAIEDYDNGGLVAA